MKQTIAFLFFLTSLVSCANANTTQDVEAIKQTIQTGYVDGLLNLGDTEITKKCFYPGFFITSLNQDNQITHYPIYNWIESVEKRKAAGEVREKKITVVFESVDVTANSAAVKMKLYEEGKTLLFTDYLLLYKFEDGWKIVQKIFYRHPKPENN